MQDQRVTTRSPTKNEHLSDPKTRNAVAEVKTRNGAKKKASTRKPNAENTVLRPALARSLVALIERDGTVTGLFRRPDEVRAFLQGGRA